MDKSDAKYIRRYGSEHPGVVIEVASLGAGNSDLEVGLGKLLHEQGCTDFLFHCLDVNPAMLARGREMAVAAGLADRYSFERADATRWKP